MLILLLLGIESWPFMLKLTGIRTSCQNIFICSRRSNHDDWGEKISQNWIVKSFSKISWSQVNFLFSSSCITLLSVWSMLQLFFLFLFSFTSWYYERLPKNELISQNVFQVRNKNWNLSLDCGRNKIGRKYVFEKWLCSLAELDVTEKNIVMSGIVKFCLQLEKYVQFHVSWEGQIQWIFFTKQENCQKIVQLVKM